ncbi:MAG: glutamyl-tRNA(Gln) amidotransferase subunit [Candidatus Woesearchaeota archaeon]|nr:glutamyl-tRNA(Gln) amidotransferase subunit [Candidatus Woesearchaeota archaeon]
MQINDFSNIGFKAGLEIHQQLDTQKLFCSCRGDNEDKYDFEVERRLNISKSEMGEIDPAALHELEKSKSFLYRGTMNSSCLVELDEEPPHEISREPLEIAIQVARLFNAKIVDSIEFMRKIVIDGSNTAGFQRTALIATDGFIALKSKKIPIETICLEEDSAKLIERGPSQDIYHLCRLGIPLVEITTAPMLSSPEELKECAKEIGLLLRSVKVKRGLGTIRQDVNLSIKGGARIEIKGAQNLKELDKLAYNEALRQLSLLKVIDELKEREKSGKINSNLSNTAPVDVSQIFKETKSNILKKELEHGKAFAVPLKGFSGILGTELLKGRRIGTEISDYAKAYSSLNGLFHRDEMPGYGITKDELSALEKKLGIKKEDSFILVAGKEEECNIFLKKALERLEMLIKGVPSEVRAARQDGTTIFLRPMPGPARMYPETDIPSIFPADLSVKTIDSIKDIIEKIISLGLPKEEAIIIAKSEKSDLFFKLMTNSKQKASYIYALLFSKPKEFKKKENLFDSRKISEEKIMKLISLLDSGKITKKQLEDAYLKIGKGEDISLEELSMNKISEEEIRRKIDEIIKENKDKSFGFLMGKAVAALKGADGKEINKILREELNKK